MTWLFCVLQVHGYCTPYENEVPVHTWQYEEAYSHGVGHCRILIFTSILYHGK